MIYKILLMTFANKFELNLLHTPGFFRHFISKRIILFTVNHLFTHS